MSLLRTIITDGENVLFYEYVFFTIFPVSQNFSGPVRTIIEILFVFQGLYNHERIKCFLVLQHSNLPSVTKKCAESEVIYCS